jgi:hypothetical protein
VVAQQTALQVTRHCSLMASCATGKLVGWLTKRIPGVCVATPVGVLSALTKFWIGCGYNPSRVDETGGSE